MARLTFPDEGSRLLYDPDTGVLLPVNTRVYLYLDAAATQPATDLLDGNGSPVTAGYVASDAYRRVPIFSGPNDGRDTLYAVVNGGPITPVYARDDDRLDALNSRVTTLEADSPATAVQSVNGHTGTAVTVSKADVGLGNADNTSDVNKPVSTAQQTAITAEATARAAADALLIPLTQKAAAGGVATLDGGGKVPTGQLPAITMNTVWPGVASQAAMLALAAEPGDVAVRTDVSANFMLAALPASTLGNWAQLADLASPVTSVFGRTGAVALAKADVTGTGLAAADVGADAAGAAAAAQAASAQKLVRTAVKTGNYTAAAGDLVPCDTTSAAFTVTLPNAPAVGTRVGIKLVTLGAGHAVTIACAGSDVFNKTGGVTTGTLTLLNQALQVQYDTGAIWTVVADDLPLTALNGSFTQVVVHGATGSTARPSSTGIVQWIGTATPANAITDDLWWDSTNLLNKHYNGAAWESSGVNAYASLVGTLYFIDHQVISTSETIGSGAGNDGFRDLATVGPTITFTVPAAQTWNILVRFGCGATTATGEGGNVAVSVDGATPAVADSASAFAVTGFGTVHREIKVTGLTAGVHTLTLKYRHSSSTAATYSFVNRWISALRVM